jgi:hypothetical protein
MAGMRDGGAIRRVSSPHLASVLVLATLIIGCVCPRGALATLRLVTLDIVPETASASPPEIAEPVTELSFAVVPAVVRRRVLGSPALPPPGPDAGGAALPTATAALAALLVGSVPLLRRLAPQGAASPSTRWDRAPPLRPCAG